MTADAARARACAVVPAPLVRGANGAVASPHHLATAAGIDALRAGGSAVDAAIATNAVLATVMGYACGLGGDAFWLIWDAAEGRAHALNGSGRSARTATIAAAHAAGLDEMPRYGPWTITVPGAIASWGEAHARFGRLPWGDLLAPAIDLAAGFPASAAWSGAVEAAAGAYGPDGDWARVYRPHGRAWRAGERVMLPALRGTLVRLAAEGPATGYTGALAARAVEHLASVGSPLRAQDLADHTCDWGDPIATDYRGHTALSHPPNSCGPLALETLNVLSRISPPPASAFDGSGVDDPRWVHLGLEASRHILADRDAVLTDLDAMAPGALDHLLSAAHADELVARLDPDRRVPVAATTLPRGGGTIHLCVVDRDGGAVSLIESNYGGFGSGVVDPQTGIAYQNRGAFFRLDPGHANALAPGKRTVHTLTPGMLLRDGRPWIIHGSMGGEIQPQVFAQVVSALVDGGVDIATAVAAPRWSATPPTHLAPPDRTEIEERYHPAVIEGLRARGQDPQVIPPWSSNMGHAHAVEIVRDAADPSAPPTFAAATDPRSEGLPGAC